jgi:hypothetical protein
MFLFFRTKKRIKSEEDLLSWDSIQGTFFSLEKFHTPMQCCGSGAGIRCFFGPYIRDRDPGWKKKSGIRDFFNL